MTDHRCQMPIGMFNVQCQMPKEEPMTNNRKSASDLKPTLPEGSQLWDLKLGIPLCIGHLPAVSREMI
jgi:hypothetical protein